MKKQKKYYARIGTALFLLCNPNIHVIDILPDFIAYFLLFSVISEAADLTPHFAQARDACKKLALIGLFKIPAYFIITVARSQNTMDSNLIPTFAIVFALLEVIFGYTLIYHVSEALFYLGQRSDAQALISPFRLCRPRRENVTSRSVFFRERKPDALRAITFVFLLVKSFSSFLPQLLLLSRKQEYVGDYAGQTEYLRLYPYALLLALVITLAIGIYWLLLSRAFLRSVRAEGKFSSAIHTLAGEALIRQKEKRELCSAYALAFTLLAIASLFSLNFMPLFCYPLFLLLGICWMRLPKSQRRITKIFGVLSVFSSFAATLMVEMFEYDYSDFDLLESAAAKSAYSVCIIATAINAVLILAFLIAIFLSLRSTILNTLGVSPKNERYGKTEKDYHTQLIRQSAIFIIFGVLSILCRSIYVYLRGEVVLIANAIGVATLSHQWEFWPLVMTVIAIPYIIYSFYYMGVMKEELAMALIDEA